MPTKVFNHGWSTENEKDWLKKLGAHRKNGLSKIEGLKKYLEASAKRTDWGNINKEEILAYAKELLEKETKKVK
jgi:hypothetical protein